MNPREQLLSFYNLIYICKLNDRQVYALGKFMNIDSKHLYEILTGNYIQQRLNYDS